jgi:hypothetical protein
VLLTHYCASDEIEKNEMDGACSACVGGERCVQGFGGKNLRERGVDGKIILKRLFRK